MMLRIETLTASAFPARLFTMLENEDKSIVDWTADGRAFKVNDLNRFRAEILPKYYRHSKITSFQRQLNLYGYIRIHNGEDTGAYAHPKFLKGRKEIVREIKRVSAIMDADPSTRAEKMNLMPTDHHTRSMIKLIDTSLVLPLSHPGAFHGGVKTRSIGVSKLSKNIGPAPPVPKKRNLFSQMDSCRALQLKSNLHSSSFSWRHVPDGKEEDASTSRDADGRVAESERHSESGEPSDFMYNFDNHVFEVQSKFPCTMVDSSSADGSVDEEFLDLLCD